MARAIQLASYSMAFILLAFILACGGIGFAYQQKMSGKYFLIATDSLEQMDISEGPSDGSNSYRGVIPGTVFEAGWDEHFIIAKQHPPGRESSTNFYILRVSDGKLSELIDEPAFDAEREKLEVPKALTFTWSLDSLK